MLVEAGAGHGQDPHPRRAVHQLPARRRSAGDDRRHHVHREGRRRPQAASHGAPRGAAARGPGGPAGQSAARRRGARAAAASARRRRHRGGLDHPLFASRLLRERPVEAGIDPAFTQLDELGSELLLSRLWREWLEAGEEGPAAAGKAELAAALAAGVSLSAVQGVAAECFGRRHSLAGAPAAPAFDAAAVVDDLHAWIAPMRTACACCLDQEDRLCGGMLRLADELDALDRSADPVDLGWALVALKQRRTSYGGKGAGARGNWPGGKDDPLGARDEALDQVEAAAHGFSAVPRRSHRGGRTRVRRLRLRPAARGRHPRFRRPARPGPRPAGRTHRFPGRSPSRARVLPGQVRLPAGRRVPGHRPAAGGDRLPPLRRRSRRHRLGERAPHARQAVPRGRPEAVHLPLPRRRHRHLPARQAARGLAGSRPRHLAELPYAPRRGALGQRRLLSHHRQRRRGPSPCLPRYRPVAGRRRRPLQGDGAAAGDPRAGVEGRGGAGGRGRDARRLPRRVRRAGLDGRRAAARRDRRVWGT